MHYKMYKILLKKYEILDDMFDYKTLIIIAILFMVMGFVMMALYKHIMARYFIIFVMLLLVWNNRKKVLSIFKTFKK